MSEPKFIAQTFEVDHTKSDDAIRAWFRTQTSDARAEGCTFFRHSMGADTRRGLLCEGWIHRPEEQGDQRWQLKAEASE